MEELEVKKELGPGALGGVIRPAVSAPAGGVQGDSSLLLPPGPPEPAWATSWAPCPALCVPAEACAQ